MSKFKILCIKGQNQQSEKATHGMANCIPDKRSYSECIKKKTPITQRQKRQPAD